MSHETHEHEMQEEEIVIRAPEGVPLFLTDVAIEKVKEVAVAAQDFNTTTALTTAHGKMTQLSNKAG